MRLPHQGRPLAKAGAALFYCASDLFRPRRGVCRAAVALGQQVLELRFHFPIAKIRMALRDQANCGAGLLRIVERELRTRQTIVGSKPARRSRPALARHLAPLDCRLPKAFGIAAGQQQRRQILLSLAVARVLGDPRFERRDRLAATADFGQRVARRRVTAPRAAASSGAERAAVSEPGEFSRVTNVSIVFSSNVASRRRALPSAPCRRSASASMTANASAAVASGISVNTRSASAVRPVSASACTSTIRAAIFHSGDSSLAPSSA